MHFAVRGVPKNLFTSTFAVCFALVGANSFLPCPVDSNYSNDSKIEKLPKKDENTMKSR